MANAFLQMIANGVRAMVGMSRQPWGPWLGRMSSVTRDQVPMEYAAGGSNFLWVPFLDKQRRGLGYWRRRGGTSILYDTAP